MSKVLKTLSLLKEPKVLAFVGATAVAGAVIGLAYVDILVNVYGAGRKEGLKIGREIAVDVMRELNEQKKS
jgi:hypothetical protein